MQPRRIPLPLLLLLLLPGVAVADDAADVALRLLSRDRDGDGRLTAVELGAPGLFSRLDADGDGFVAREEIETYFTGERGDEHVSHLDVPYAAMDGVDPRLLALDLYAPRAARRAPVLVMIHGGGWRAGDKGGSGMTRAKVPRFTGAGWVYVSVNYRLSPDVVHPAHVQDVAKAVAWIHDHVADYGGDPERIFLMGHSAGAHLAALVATDHRWLEACGGKSLRILAGVVLLDGAGYDLVRRLDELPDAGLGRVFRNAFGDDRATWRDASPITHVAPDKGIPPFLLFHAGRRRAARTNAEALAEALRAAGVPAKTVHAPDRDHAGMNRRLGDPDDPYTEMVMAFLARPRAYASGAPATPTALFVRAEVPGLTDTVAGTNGFAVADLDHDGRLDLVLVQDEPVRGARSWGRARPQARLRVLLNEGAFRFREHALEIAGSELSSAEFGFSPQIPNLADFDGDGHLDLLVSRTAAVREGKPVPWRPSPGNTLLLSDGAFDRFRDVSDEVGIRNETGYNRQTAIGDVNGDGWLDVAVGCDNIGNALGGLPWSRLYVFRPKEGGFRGGRFEDVGGTDLVPDFGGFHHDPAKDRAGPDLTLRDLDLDGDLDLVQACHADVREPLLPFSPGEYRQGMFVWRNRLKETGAFSFEKIETGGLPQVGRLRYDREAERYVPVETGPGLPYVACADVDNDGDLDVLAVGPSDLGWSPRAEDVGARFWRNLGDFRFEEATEKAGFGALNRTYREWYAFFGLPLLDAHRNWSPRSATYSSQPGLARRNPIDNRPYYSDAVFGDFDNDGWVDVVVLDRRASKQIASRAVLFRNRGDGTFVPTETAFSGLDRGGISGEAADLDGDGLLDLVFAADPDNSGGWRFGATAERYQDRVYRNTGAHGAKENHWLGLRFAGVSHAALCGARIEARDPTTGGLLGTRVVASHHTYKSGGALQAHFGLGRHRKAAVRVTLADGTVVEPDGVAVDRYVDVNLEETR